MTAGIYKITNLSTSEFYIGKSKNLLSRKRMHFWELSTGRHDNILLLNDYRKYGRGNFMHEVVLICEVFELSRYEKLLIQRLKPYYNSQLTGNSRRRQYIDPPNSDIVAGLETAFKPQNWHRLVYGDGKSQQ